MLVLPKTHVVVVGAGPAGLAPLLSAARGGELPSLLQAGVALVERSDAVGIGRIGRYLINSDSSAETFLSCVQGDVPPPLAALARHPTALAIAPYGKGSVPLRLVGDFLHAVGQVLQEMIARSPNGQVLTRHEAIHTRRRAGGGWTTHLRAADTGRSIEIPSRSVLLATGGHQPEARLEVDTVAGVRLLPRYRLKVMQSDVVMTRDGLDAVERRLQGIDRPRIAIVGGSTSALACARLLLTGLRRPLPPESITLMHRGALKLFYPSADAARADGYHQFGDDDICPVSRFVFRFGGFRFESRDLVMSLTGVGGRPAEHRIVLHRLADGGPADVPVAPPHLSRRCLEDADIVIACLGYRPLALPVLDEAGTPIPLLAEKAGRPLVDERCGILDAEGRPIEGLLGLGLAAGFVPGGRMGGEPSHRGQVNGLWLWQNDVGALLARRLLDAQPPAADPSRLRIGLGSRPGADGTTLRNDAFL